MSTRSLRRLAAAVALVPFLVLSACGDDRAVVAPLSSLASASVVTVRASGCGDPAVSGVGFFVEADLVVTAAHVVAGADAVVVQLFDGGEADAVVVELDAERDVAVLAVSRLGPPLALSDVTTSGDVVIIGRSGLGTDSRVERLIMLTIPDIYMGDRVDRRSLELAGPVGPGMSGAPVMDHTNSVTGMVVASSEEHGYAVAALELRAVLAGRHDWRGDAGGCAVNEPYDCIIGNPRASLSPACSSPSLARR